ncbi:hypothetical protein HK101_001249 [Irineochytrium annulatum]|nr:hypothetical protein HK101_001249 [Irineochytrium annulatum]
MLAVQALVRDNPNITEPHFRDCWEWHTGNLSITAGDIKGAHGGAVKVEVVDVGGFLRGIIDTPGDASHGIVNVTVPCAMACKAEGDMDDSCGIYSMTVWEVQETEDGLGIKLS